MGTRLENVNGQQTRLLDLVLDLVLALKSEIPYAIVIIAFPISA